MRLKLWHVVLFLALAYGVYWLFFHASSPLYGVLHGATPGNDYCNGNIAIIQSANDYACMCDCLHVDDVAEVLAEKGLDRRPEGK